MKFKHKKDKELFLSLHLALIMIYSDMANYAKVKHGIDIVITDTVSTKEDDERLKRVSDSHQLKIALDWRTFNIKNEIVLDIVGYINNKPEYKEYRYLSNSGVYRLAYWHNNGNGQHCHLAIHKSYGIVDNIERIASSH